MSDPAGNTIAAPGSPDWERLPSAAVVAMYLRGIQKAVRENLFVFVGGGTGALVSDAFGLRELALVGGGLLLLALLATLIYHRRFRFLVADDAVRVRSGLFEVKELKVRFERVQNVAFSQPLYLKPLGLTRVKLETPGASQTEVELPGIPHERALALRDRVAGAQHDHRADRREAARSADAAERGLDSPALFAPSFGDLFRYGMTSSQLWIVLGVVAGPLAERIGDRVEDSVAWLERVGLIGIGELSSAPLLAVGLVLAVIALFIALGLIVSGLIAWVRFYGYRLTGDPERLQAVYGLLDKREKSLKRAKLHSLEVVQTAFGRLLGRWHAVGHQAGLDALNPINQDKRFLVPGIPNARLEEVTSELADRAWSPPSFRRIDPRFRHVLWKRLVLLPLLLALAGWWFSPADSVALPLLLVGLGVVAAGLIHLRWRRWGVHVGEHGLQLRYGLIGTTILLFEDARCQQIRIQQSPYQRRHGLATLLIGLPHGVKTVPWLPESLAAALANRLLMRIETSRVHAL
ncbi:MAG: PH domain-containing protein [Wenzhouxiangellaceae bacterium]|nr:PH domain-containing protein [Wenzhouxiangellaceae bacterium]